jgi:predicted kinase
MHGVSGSGKSTVAQQFANERGAIILKADAIRKHITNTPLTKSDAVIYDRATSDLVYLFLVQNGINSSEVGFDVVLDATFLDVNKRKEVITTLQNSAIDVKILSVECSEETAKSRIDARVGEVSDATSEILKLQLEKFTPLTENERKITKVIIND